MQLSDSPTLVPLPFADSGSKNVIPEAASPTPGLASLTTGFPPVTMTPLAAGGIPPAGQDMNGILNLITQSTRWAQGGGPYAYNSAFATDSNVNGYPQGSVISRADYTGQWISTADNNTVNPDTVGTNWVPGYNYGTTAVTGLTNANVTLTPAQAAKSRITLAGTLTGNVQIIFPVWTKDWSIVNNTTGAFTVTCKTSAGTGIAIPQDASPTKITGDGTNITQPAENIPPATASQHAVQLGQVTGRVLRTTIYEIVGGVQMVSIDGGAFTATGATTFSTQALTTKTRYKIHGGAGAGGGAQGTGASQQSVGAGGACGGISEGWIVGPLVTTAITVGANGVPGAAGLSPGGNGGSSSIGALITANGGSGGSAGQLTSTYPLVSSGGAGGIVTAAGSGILPIYSMRGPSGGIGLNAGSANVASGSGANSPIGAGGQAVGGTQAGAAGTGLNSGGSGGVCFGSIAGGQIGGAGTPGYIEFVEYA